jgi:hypothetical protein
VADEARRTSGSGQNFGGLNAAAKFWAPQQVMSAAKLTGGLSVIRQPLRQKSKIFATSPYTGEARARIAMPAVKAA